MRTNKGGGGGGEHIKRKGIRAHGRIESREMGKEDRYT